MKQNELFYKIQEEDKKGFEINKRNANLLLDVLEMMFRFHYYY